MFHFVINPNDFAQSVENIFYLSFLIRDGQVAWEVEDAEPFVCMCPGCSLKSISHADFDRQMLAIVPMTRIMRTD